MELSPSWEADNCAVPQELPSILWNLKFHYHVHKSPQLIPIPNQISPIHIILSYISKIHFNIVHPPPSWSSQWSPSFRLSHKYPICIPPLPIRATWPAYLILLDLINKLNQTRKTKSTKWDGWNSYYIWVKLQCVRKVAVRLGYGTLQRAGYAVACLCWSCRWSVLLLCDISLYSVVEQRLKCNTGEVINCWIQFCTHYGSFNWGTCFSCWTHLSRRQ
jgi:hypothetical protein